MGDQAAEQRSDDGRESPCSCDHSKGRAAPFARHDIADGGGRDWKYAART